MPEQRDGIAECRYFSLERLSNRPVHILPDRQARRISQQHFLQLVIHPSLDRAGICPASLLARYHIDAVEAAAQPLQRRASIASTGCAE